VLFLEARKDPKGLTARGVCTTTGGAQKGEHGDTVLAKPHRLSKYIYGKGVLA